LIPIFELVKTSDREWFRDYQVKKLEISVWISESGRAAQAAVKS
jgi:hypothetical protein